jgi:peptidoglycan hydrolase-like protein with peptidoglycan-binding domain
MVYKIDDKWIYVYDSYEGGLVRNPLDYAQPALMKIVVTPKVPTQYNIPPITKDLWFGMRDTEVRFLQQKLIKLGHLSKGLDTGYYGPLTTLAVKQFQWVNKVASIPVLLWNGGRLVASATRSKLNLL